MTIETHRRTAIGSERLGVWVRAGLEKEPRHLDDVRRQCAVVPPRVSGNVMQQRGAREVVKRGIEVGAGRHQPWVLADQLPQPIDIVAIERVEGFAEAWMRREGGDALRDLDAMLDCWPAGKPVLPGDDGLRIGEGEPRVQNTLERLPRLRGMVSRDTSRTGAAALAVCGQQLSRLTLQLVEIRTSWESTTGHGDLGPTSSWLWLTAHG